MPNSAYKSVGCRFWASALRPFVKCLPSAVIHMNRHLGLGLRFGAIRRVSIM
jgi:hypothetical protein